jgi:hypothetical protein
MGSTFQEKLQLPADSLTRVRFIQSQILPLSSIFRTYNEIFKGLLQLDARLKHHSQISTDNDKQIVLCIQNLVRQNASFTQYTRFLLSKAEHMAQMICDNLMLKHQHVVQDQNSNLCNLNVETHKQNGFMCEMTRAAVKDSATIRAITIVMFLYMPVTFVSVSPESSIICITEVLKWLTRYFS